MTAPETVIPTTVLAPAAPRTSPEWVSEYIGGKLTTADSGDLINGGFVCSTGTVTHDGHIVVTITAKSFVGEDQSVRVLLQPTLPVPVTSSAAPGSDSPSAPSDQPATVTFVPAVSTS